MYSSIAAKLGQSFATLGKSRCPKILTLGSFASIGDHERLATAETICNDLKGHHSESIHVSYIGGIDENGGKAKDNRTDTQKKMMLQLICRWVTQLNDNRIFLS